MYLMNIKTDMKKCYSGYLKTIKWYAPQMEGLNKKILMVHLSLMTQLFFLFLEFPSFMVF